MKLSEILSPECVCVPLTATDKPTSIRSLVALLAKSGRIGDEMEVVNAVLSREQARSTGIGLGLAVPHGRSPQVRALSLAVGRMAQPIEFGSIDGRPCEFIALLASPAEQNGPHIQALAAMSRLWLNEQFRREVLSASSPSAVYDAFTRFQTD